MPQPNSMQSQQDEFDAVAELSMQYRRIQLTPVVDDDYPEARHAYERAMRQLIAAIRTKFFIKECFHLNSVKITRKEALTLLNYHLAMVINCYEIVDEKKLLEYWKQVMKDSDDERVKLCGEFITSLIAIYKTYE